MIINTVIFFSILVFAFCVGLRAFDWLSDRNERKKLLSLQVLNPLLYDATLVKDLPEPTRRYFNFMIKPGARLFTVAEIEMTGEFSLGNKAQPNDQAMFAKQVLAAPHGFIWELCLPGFISVSGSDSGVWTRFRILGVIPVARIGDDLDHRRAAFGRYVAEAVFWTPAALLPSDFVEWVKIDYNTSRVTVKYQELRQEVDVQVDQSGKPIKVSFMRWSNANPDKTYRLQPFGGYLSNFKEVQGFMLPFDVVAGNMFETEEYFPFFKAKLKSIRFPFFE